jgi:hypothetical protein
MRIEAFAVAALVLGFTANANAFCQTTTCGPGECQPSAGCVFCLEGGKNLYWANGCMSFSVQIDGSAKQGISAQVAQDLVGGAFLKWMSADCGGGQTPGLHISQTPFVDCREQEYNQEDKNANIWLFSDDRWPYANSGNTLALTTITFNVDTGEIYDADVEINSSDPATTKLTIGNQNIQSDLDSIVTHEAGHFLGLAHSCDKQATMFASYVPGTTSLRDLAPDDMVGICTIYQPGSSPDGCDPTPRHGFSVECGSDPKDPGCCTTAPGGPDRGGTASLVALIASLAFVSRRRFRRGGRAMDQRIC